MDTYNVRFGDYEVSFRTSNEYLESYSTNGYFKRLKKVARKIQKISN